MRQLKQKDVKEVREQLRKKNEGLCPILKIPLDPCDAALDHAHQDSEISETVEGQIRDTIHKYANSLEGSMRSKFIRSGCSQFITFEEFLYNLWFYLMNHRQPMLHPSHATKPPKLQKRSYNELKREIERTNEYLEKPVKIPPYPKSGRLSKRLKELFENYGIKPRYYAK